MSQTELPYLGTEGYVTRPASILRATDNVTSGVAHERQSQVLAHLANIPSGATWVEVGHALQLHHGQVSSTLSVLHQAGKVFQLRECRSRSHPYVHEKYRFLYVESERFDAPTRTNGKVLRERIDNAATHLECAELWLDGIRENVAEAMNAPASSLQDMLNRVSEQIVAALATLNGERDEV